MINDEDPEPGSPSSPAERLLAMAESNPELRGRLIERWARADTWTRVEGIALAWTLDPSTLGRSELIRTRPETALPEEARHYLDLAGRNSTLFPGFVTPARFIGWAHQVGLAFHPAWHDAIARVTSETAASRVSEKDRRREPLVRRWARAPYWSPEEGTVLAYDLDPQDTIQRPAAGYDRPSLRAPADVKHLCTLAHRAIDIGALEDASSPLAFMKWARKTGVEFHSDWWDSVVEEPEPAEDQAEATPSAVPVAVLSTREQESLLKMVVGMAMAFYGWDPKALRNPKTGEIARDLELAGVSLDQDTIRKWLRRGADLVLSQGP